MSALNPILAALIYNGWRVSSGAIF